MKWRPPGEPKHGPRRLHFVPPWRGRGDFPPHAGPRIPGRGLGPELGKYVPRSPGGGDLFSGGGGWVALSPIARCHVRVPLDACALWVGQNVFVILREFAVGILKVSEKCEFDLACLSVLL